MSDYKKCDYKRLVEVTTPGQGPILYYYTVHHPDWIADQTVAESLDMEYLYNHSGDKIISPLVNKLLPDSGKLTTQIYVELAKIMGHLFGTSWDKEFATYAAEYDPISNYDMEEVMTDDETVTEYGKTTVRTDDTQSERTDNTQSERTDDLLNERTDDTTLLHTQNLTHVKSGTETQAPDITVETGDSVYGFNSSDAVPSTDRTEVSSGEDMKTYDVTDTDTDSQTDRATGTVSTTDTGTVTTTDTGTVTVENTGTVRNADTGSDTQTRNYTLTRKGNIGVTTSQQLLQAERDLWLWSFFEEVVFPGIDRVLTIDTY